MPIHATHPKRLQNLQRLWLGVGCINLLLFYMLPSPSGVAQPNLLATVWLLFLYSRVGHWSVERISNSALSAGFLLLAYVSYKTGGINSPIMVWFSLLPVLVLTVLGMRAGWLWFAASWLLALVLYAGTQWGWVNPEVHQDRFTGWWALALVLSVLFTQQFIVNVYGRNSLRQVQELEAHNTEFEQAQKALLQAQSHKDEFIASMGHELRTPMNAILGLNGVLQEELKDRAEDLQLAELIRGSTEQLLGLVNNILLLSQLEAGRVVLNTRPVAIRVMLQRQQSKWSEVVRAKGVALEVHCGEEVPQWVQLDEERFEQVLNQLLDNAIKFTQQGHVLLEVSARLGQLRVDVQDTGPGIAKDKLETIFDRFEQADVNTNRAYGGTGIGLAIAKRLVELHHGQLQVESELARGAHFW